MKFLSVASVASLLSVFGVSNAHNEAVPPHGKICYFANVRVGDKFNVDFQVGNRDSSSSDQPHLDFYVLNQSKLRIYNRLRVADGDENVDVKSDGRYEICFSNEYSSDSTKDVTFHIDHVWGSELRSEHYDTMEGQLKLLDRLVADIAHESEYLRIRERTHRNTAESTNNRVKWWSIAQLLFVIASSGFQVLYLKRFFEVRSNV